MQRSHFLPVGSQRKVWGSGLHSIKNVRIKDLPRFLLHSSKKCGYRSKVDIVYFLIFISEVKQKQLDRTF